MTSGLKDDRTLPSRSITTRFTANPMHVEPIRWRGDALELLDQRLLPREVHYVACRDAHEVAVAIRDMIVRGAPAIGVSAAFGIALAAQRGDDIDAAAAELRASRPTAVNLMWALDRMLRARDAGHDLTAEAEAMFREDVEANKRIGRYGAELLGNSVTVLTHCNAGALATAGYGTALGVIRAAVESGKRVAVFADETRPYLQGARLTAWELQQEGIDVTLITDSMAGSLLPAGALRCRHRRRRPHRRERRHREQDRHLHGGGAGARARRAVLCRRAALDDRRQTPDGAPSRSKSEAPRK